jgi:branched-chain amino acid transport system ATP-binding protein
MRHSSDAVASPILAVSGLCVRRGPLLVVEDVSLDVHAGRCVGLLGLNGAGKSSLLECLAGVIPSSAGRIVVDGADVTAVAPWERCRAGLVLVPSGRRLFKGLTVADNLLLGGHLEKDRSAQGRALSDVYELFPMLAARRSQKAGSLSGGQQQMVAIGRGLMAQPKVLLLDEPSEGLAPVVVEHVFDVISSLKRTQLTTILLAEQNAGVVDVCDELLLMREGRIATQGQASDTETEKVKSYVFGN